MNSISVWGDKDWGSGYWGTPEYNIIQNDRNISTAIQGWDSGLTIAPNSNVRALIRSLLSVTDRIDTDLEEIYEQQHINSATGEQLDKWGRLVDVNRKTGEADAKYRARIKAEFRQATMETTFDQFVEFTASVLGTSVENVTLLFNFEPDPATVTVSMQSSVFDQLNLTNADVQDLLDGGVPAGHEVKIIEEGTFRVKADGDVDDADKGLTSDSISTGGTLASDLL